MTSRSPLSTIPIRFAKGVGPRRAPLLEKLGVRTVDDALWFIPWRYDNRLEVLPIRHLSPGMKATVRGIVLNCRVNVTSRRGLVIVVVAVRDETGILECVFFNQPFLKSTFVPGAAFLVTGTVLSDSRNASKLIMRAPLYELVEDGQEECDAGRIIPIYHETQGLSSKQIRRTIRGILDQYLPQVEEILPVKLEKALGFPRLREALPVLHCPPPDRSVALLNERVTPEHQRLAFEELFLLQLALGMRRLQWRKGSEGIAFRVSNSLVERFQAHLPFPLTDAQKRVIDEIRRDMAQSISMNRLLQGDVGSGKTIVALHAMLMACGSGYQAAMMAPTEVLSAQHHASLLPFCQDLGITCLLIKGRQATKEREENLKRIRSGGVQIIIGTHALLQPDVVFEKLGLVIVDEQHKFGVLQRARLREKGGRQPDVLVMTATPIPRTLAMTMYGYLDVSVIDQFPPGKKPVVTRLFQRSQRKSAYELMREELERGRQAYVVFPLVEPSEKVDLQAAVEAADQLKKDFPQFRVGVLHGRLSSADKRQVMEKFRDRKIHILVSTTVVEVGLDIHNATVMLIEHAERFGLAQLHQLRGRIGRGAYQGYCLLLHSLGKIDVWQGQESMDLKGNIPSSPIAEWPVSSAPFTRSLARRRLQIFANCSDGFTLAEEDLKIRGPGQVLGIQQWGELHFRVADLGVDLSILMKAREIARDVLQRDPELTLPEHGLLRDTLFRQWNERFAMGSIG
jgi:ATP-dependent DNA helicase RecG